MLDRDSRPGIASSIAPRMALHGRSVPMKTGWRRRGRAFGATLAAVGLAALAMPSAASADTMRTLNLAFSCATGLPYGLEVNTGSGWYYPNGSSYASGTTKYFTVYIPASASMLEYQPTYCDNQPTGGGYPMWEGYSYGISPGSSTINATGGCQDYNYSVGYGVTYLFYYCSISSLSYS
jgi:hypothetical protein